MPSRVKVGPLILSHAGRTANPASSDLEHHLLHLVQAHNVIPPVIQLRRPRALMGRHLLRLLQIPAPQLTPSGKIEIEAPELPRTPVVGIFRENGKLSSRGTQVA